MGIAARGPSRQTRYMSGDKREFDVVRPCITTRGHIAVKVHGFGKPVNHSLSRLFDVRLLRHLVVDTDHASISAAGYRRFLAVWNEAIKTEPCSLVEGKAFS